MRAPIPGPLFDRDTYHARKPSLRGAGVLPRGALLGKITASGKYVLSLAAANDGSQVPDAVSLGAGGRNRGGR
jgi:hypothetical protein